MKTEDCQSSGRRGVAMLMMCVLLAAGCQAPHNSIQSIIKRQAEALERLPEEDRRRMMPPQEPVETAQPMTPVVPDVITLDDARRVALQANPDIHAAQARMQAALARIGEARAPFFPQIAAVQNSTRTFQVPRYRNSLVRVVPTQPPVDLITDEAQINFAGVFQVLSNRIFSTQSATGDSNSFSQHSSTLNAVWTLFDGFAREAQLMASKYRYRASAMAMADVERLLVRAVDTAYLQVLLGREQLRIAMADLDFSREQLEVARKRQGRGKVTEADVLNFEVRVRSAEASVTAARGTLETGRVVLAELMAVPDAKLPDSCDLPPLAEEAEWAMTKPDEIIWLERAAQNRPDLARRKHLVSVATENTVIARGQFSPTVTLSGSWGFENKSNMSYARHDQASALGIEVNWQLFTGGFRTSQLQRVLEEQREAVANLERTRLAVASDVRQSIVSLEIAQQEVRLQRLAIEAAAENRRIVTAQYAAGKASVERLNEAQRDFVRTDVDLTSARIRLRQAWTDLYAATASYADGVNWDELVDAHQEAESE